VITFKGKQYPLRTLFIRDEAKLAKQFDRFKDEDLEIRTDAMIEIVRVNTGIDLGDLNGSTLAEIRDVLNQVMAEREALRVPAPKEDDGGGKAEGASN
jgi:hypothetical protein